MWVLTLAWFQLSGEIQTSQLFSRLILSPPPLSSLLTDYLHLSTSRGMLLLILLTRNGERFSPSGGVIDRGACWNGSEPLLAAQSRSPVETRKRRNKNNTGGFTLEPLVLLHSGCLFPPLISVHLPLLLLLCPSLSRRLPLRQHGFRSGPDRCRISGSRARRTTASLPERVHTRFPRSVLNVSGVVYRRSQSRKHQSALEARRRPTTAVKRFAVENMRGALKKCHKLTFIHVIDSSLILIVCGNTKEYAEPCQTASSRDCLMEGRPAAFS